MLTLTMNAGGDSLWCSTSPGLVSASECQMPRRHWIVCRFNDPCILLASFDLCRIIQGRTMRRFRDFVFCCCIVLFSVQLSAQEQGVYRSIIPQPTDQERFEPLPIPLPSETVNGGNVIQAAYFTEDTQDLDGDFQASVKEEQKQAEQKQEEEKQATKEKRDDVAEQIRVAEIQLQDKKSEQEAEQSPEEASAATTDSVEENRLRLLKQLEVVLAQRNQQSQKLKDATVEFSERKVEHQNVVDGQLGFEKPYSFLILDQLQDELATFESQLASSELNESLVNADIVQAKVQVEAVEQDYRQAKESGEVVSENLASDNSRPAIELKLAHETLEYRKRRLELQNLFAETTKTRLETAKAKLVAIQDQVVFSELDLKAKQDELDKREADFRSRLGRLEAEMERSDVKWLADRQMQNADANRTPIESEELELRRLDRQRLQARVSSLNFRMELVSQSRYAWSNRYQFANRLSTQEKNIEIEQQAKEQLQQRERDFANRMLQQNELRKTVAALDTKIEALADDENGNKVRRLIERQKSAVRGKMSTVDEDVAAIQANRRINEKLLADIQGDSQRYSFANMSQNTWHRIKGIWNTELTTVDERSITIGKVCMALLIFVGGFFVSRWLSRWLGSFMTRRLKVDQSAAAAFQSLGFYGLLMSFLLGALNFVSIPLTVFTFLGGALAIGVGFGSQNILSNFISGLILLAERPVKVGDLIEMDEYYGNVEAIGARSTIVRTGTNLRLVVPNSKLLENNVINYTHGSNDVIRINVCVGVAYGSDVQQVTQLLQQAAAEHGKVLKSPEAFVLFKDFADNSLNFELHFWINMIRPLDQLRMESDIRYRIDSLFNEAGVVIAFPQRDIHLNASSPIPLHLVDAQGLACEMRKAPSA